MDDLKSILQRVLKTTPHYEQNKARLEIFEAWPRIVGERVASHCRPVRFFEDGTLLVGAESNVWLHSLKFLETQILEKYEAELKKKKVKQLRFRLGFQKD